MLGKVFLAYAETCSRSVTVFWDNLLDGRPFKACVEGVDSFVINFIDLVIGDTLMHRGKVKRPDNAQVGDDDLE